MTCRTCLSLTGSQIHHGWLWNILRAPPSCAGHPFRCRTLAARRSRRKSDVRSRPAVRLRTRSWLRAIRSHWTALDPKWSKVYLSLKCPDMIPVRDHGSRWPMNIPRSVIGLSESATTGRRAVVLCATRSPFENAAAWMEWPVW